MAEEELHRVGDITKQLLQFHRDSVAPKALDVQDLLESVLTLYKNRLEMRQIEVIRQYGSAPPIRAHPGELRQAFSNLIANAIDAMPGGEGSVSA
jgi:signal transduction histidine kinase